MLSEEVDTVIAVMITQQLELFVLGLPSAGLGDSHSYVKRELLAHPYPFMMTYRQLLDSK